MAFVRSDDFDGVQLGYDERSGFYVFFYQHDFLEPTAAHFFMLLGISGDGFHLGLHLHSKLKKLETAANGKKADGRNSACFAILQILWILIFALGIFCIVHSQLYVYLFWQNAWKLSAPNIFVCVSEYLGMTAGMIVLSHFAMKLFTEKKHR